MVECRERKDSNPDIMVEKPKIKGTSNTVDLILRKILDGNTFDEILDMYPKLIMVDILSPS